ncbi:MAG: membrane protein insertase YidC, partial [Gammaproteobacteria bacterium]|nr:membrane protein insertase YidC [Gammaproteobacteria bacterium]
MDNQRLILFVVLGFLFLMLWQSWVDYSSPTLPVKLQTVNSNTENVAGAAIPETPSLNSESPVLSQAPLQNEKMLQPAGQKVLVETDLLKVEINTNGAGLNKVWLKKYTVDIDHPDDLFQLMNDKGEDIYTAQSGLLVQGREFPTHKTLFTSSKKSYKMAENEDVLNVEFLWNSADGIAYKKIYTFHRDSYIVDLSFKVINPSSTAWTGFQYNQFKRSQLDSQGSFNPATMVPSYTGGAIYDKEEKYQKFSFSDMLDENIALLTTNGWVGMLQHYFVGAWLLEENSKYEIFSNNQEGNIFFFGYKTLSPVTIQPGRSGELTTRIYVGPKETRRLKNAAPGLELTVDYGWLTAISSPLYWLLDKIHSLVGNWGWAIIILTMMIKLVFYPLSAASHKS